MRSFSFVLLLLALAGCAERLTFCHCALLDYGRDGRRSGDAMESDTGASCGCESNRKRTTADEAAK